MTKVLFIVNPIAGTNHQRGVRQAISRCRLEWSLKETRYAGQARELAASSKADIVVAVGGDGTVNEVASALVGTDRAMAIVPCGSGNGLARHMRVSLNPVEAVEVIDRCRIETIDTGLVNGMPFFCTCGVGLDAQVSDRFARAGSRGLPTYIREAFRVWTDFKPATYEVTVDGTLISSKAVLVTVANANQWGNNGLIAPCASLQDGLLNVTIVAPFNSFRIPGLVVGLLSGKIDRMHGVYSYIGSDIRIVPDRLGPAHRDGDPFGPIDSLHATIRPSSLKVVLP